jgi:membrane fusion protein, heavy metal efflux system
MRVASLWRPLGLICLILVTSGIGWWFFSGQLAVSVASASLHEKDNESGEQSLVEIKAKARKNLGLITQPARPTYHWKLITVPGVIRDRPGVSDRGVTSPAVGVVSAIYAFPGDTVKPGQKLVTLQLFSEYLQATQTQLFKATQETNLIKTQIERLGGAVESGAISGTRMLELRNDLQRQQIAIQAARQELLNRGLSVEAIETIATGSFVSSMDIVAPPLSNMPPKKASSDVAVQAVDGTRLIESNMTELPFEVHGLNVELGQTVQAGELLLNLANHQSLYVVGHAFKQDAEVLERAALNGTAVKLEFAEDAPAFWPDISQDYTIRHLSNTVDVNSRTFDFFVPLSNQHQQYEKDGNVFLVWRYRPGQRVRIDVPVEKLENVFVFPVGAVVKEEGEAFVYQQNGDLFKQLSVHVVYQDRLNAVIANDGSIIPGTFVVQNAAASLRRILKSQANSGHQPGVHVHADGTVHAAH